MLVLITAQVAGRTVRSCNGDHRVKPESDSTLKIINLPITPYNDDVAGYINSIEPGDIYRLFNERNTADVLTAALYAVSQLESDARDMLVPADNGDIARTNPNSLPQSRDWVLDDAMRQCRNGVIDPEILKSLGLVYDRDNLLFKSNLNDMKQYPNVFVATVGGVYAGHAYAWTVETEAGCVTNIVGVRSSILQIMKDSCGLKQRGMAPMFFSAIRSWALERSGNKIERKNGKPHYIRYLQPIGLMPKILAKCGFTHAKRFRNSEEKKWLFQNISLGNTPLSSGLIFREYDYIVEASHPMECNPPSHVYRTINSS